MNQTETVSLMAAILYAASQSKAQPDQQKLFYDRTANQAWDLYNAVQLTSTEAAQRGTARYS